MYLLFHNLSLKQKKRDKWLGSQSSNKKPKLSKNKKFPLKKTILPHLKTQFSPYKYQQTRYQGNRYHHKYWKFRTRKLLFKKRKFSRILNSFNS